MKEQELRKYIGGKIKEFRIKKNMTQKEVGDKIGVQNNTISAYERGASTLGQDILFSLSDVLDVKVDDFFPEREHKTDDFERALKLANKLDLDEMEFLRELIEKALSMDSKEREKFLDSIRFVVEYHNKIKDS